MRFNKILLITVLCFFGNTVFAQKKFTGTFSNGYKGAKLSFILSANGKEIKDFTFEGYWRCGGSIELITSGPVSYTHLDVYKRQIISKSPMRVLKKIN